MDEAEFDKFAKEYKEMHKSVIGASGEDTDFFAEYKVEDTAQLISAYDFPEDLAIMDFGSGIGQSVPFFRSKLPLAQLTCLDVSKKSLEIGSEKFSDQAKFIHFDGTKIPLEDNSFHVIFSACVFHHIPHEAHLNLMRDIYRILKPGGIFIVFEHNPKNFLTIKAVDKCPFDDNAVLIQGNKFRETIEECRFSSVQLRYRLFFPGPFRFMRFLEKYMTWIPFGAQYYISAEKR